jgi:hypothetical protein
MSNPSYTETLNTPITEALNLSEECLARLKQLGITTLDKLLSCYLEDFMVADFGIVCFKELHIEMERIGYTFSGE